MISLRPFAANHLKSTLLLLGLVTVLASCATASNDAPAALTPEQPPELVVLAHGMGRTAVSMLPLELALERAGYRVLNFGYSSYGPGIAEISGELAGELTEALDRQPAPRVHFVGHSLGNIVVRQLLLDSPPPADLGRFVMLAPPNRGSATADRYTPYLGWLLAPISELRTEGSTVVGMPPPAHGVDFAIIAGRWDGKVSLREACLPGANASAIVPSGHTLIAMHPAAIRLVGSYLAHGAFPDDGARSQACPEQAG